MISMIVMVIKLNLHDASKATIFNQSSFFSSVQFLIIKAALTFHLLQLIISSVPSLFDADVSPAGIHNKLRL